MSSRKHGHAAMKCLPSRSVLLLTIRHSCCGKVAAALDDGKLAELRVNSAEGLMHACLSAAVQRLGTMQLLCCTQLSLYQGLKAADVVV